MLRLTRHFVENYRDRVGGDPDTQEINKTIRQAVRIQKAKDGYTRDGYFKILALYWHVPKAWVISVDPFKKKVVTIVTGANMPKEFNTHDIGLRQLKRRRF